MSNRDKKRKISNGVKIKNSTCIIIVLTAFFVLSFFFVFNAQAYQYTPMEPIPGFEGQNNGDLPTFISNFYSFGIWTVGIAALLMVFIGGYMYFMAAGNQGKVDTAKKIITDALIGVILAFSAWLLLYIINPDLVNVELRNLDVIRTNTNKNAINQEDCTGDCETENLVTGNLTKGSRVWENNQCICMQITAESACSGDCSTTIGALEYSGTWTWNNTYNRCDCISNDIPL